MKKIITILILTLALACQNYKDIPDRINKTNFPESGMLFIFSNTLNVPIVKITYGDKTIFIDRYPKTRGDIILPGYKIIWFRLGRPITKYYTVNI